MSDIKKTVLAFPQPITKALDGSITSAFEHHPGFAGMELRDWFAGLALQGMLSTKRGEFVPLIEQKELASCSYSIADAMMAAREKTP